MNKNILECIGNTPVTHVRIGEHFGFYAKLEGMNPFGSMKDRAAYYLLMNKIKDGTITSDTQIIESSSGNFGIALSATGKALGKKVICVIDPKIMDVNKKILELYGAELKTVYEMDCNGTYQKSRIEFVKSYIKKHPNTYWTNQYNNELIIQSYFQLAKEILSQVPNLTHIYIPISTCGTIAGISTYLKSMNKNINIIAVDVEGSRIYNANSTHNCYFPGMGSGIVPKNYSKAIIDDVVIISDSDCAITCRELLNQGILCGASSGGVTAAIKKSLPKHSINDVVVGVFPDRGERYLSNLYNDEWCKKRIICSYPLFSLYFPTIIVYHIELCR